MIENLPRNCKALLLKGVAELSLGISEAQIKQLLKYVALLNKWNKAFNLTAIRDPEAMITRHILDSLSVSTYLEGEEIIDVGTGPGIPGIPLAIIFPKRRFTLIDSNGKKVRFIEQAKQNLNLTNISPLQQRVESYNPEQKFDSVISRAFTSLEQMVEMTCHLVGPKGLMQAMKGVEPESVKLLDGWCVDKIIKLQVPGLDEQRHLVNIKKQ